LCASTRESGISTHNPSLLTDLTGKKKLIAELSIANVQDSEIARRAQTTIGYVWKVKSELRKGGLLSSPAVGYDKPDPENLPVLEDSAKLEQLGDEELKALASQVRDAKRRAEASRLKYLARHEKDRLEAEAARYTEKLEDHEALSDASKLATYVERVLAKHPFKLSELKKRIEGFGLTLKEALRDELEITADDYDSCRELYRKYTALPYPSLADHIIDKVDSWLRFEKLEERKANLKPYLDSHCPVCPKCGLEYLEGVESGAISCLSMTCGWSGQLNCPVCSAPMRYSSLYKALQCTDDYCGLTWRLWSA
jgi:hypothetical protein